MNDKIFDLLYKAEQREIEARLLQKEKQNRNLPLVESSCISFGNALRNIRNILQSLVSKSERE